MRFRQYLILFILGCTVSISIATLENWPGYMDADYYFAGGKRLASGFGFSEIILWNFLDDPEGIPHPSHMYWMPLTSIIVAAGMKILSDLSFSAGRTGFILIAGLLPPVTGAVAYSFSHRKISAFLAGFLAAFSGFYAPYLVTTDSFSIFALLGGVFFLLLDWYSNNKKRKLHRKIFVLLAFGVITGLMHLTRTDGVIWFIIFGLLVVSYLARGFVEWSRSQYESRKDRSSRLWSLTADLVVFILGYSIVMGPWIIRNFLVFDSYFPPGGWRVLWLTNYDEIFIYPAIILTPSRWLATGLQEILEIRIWALGQNFQTTIAVQGMIILLPLMLVGMWEYRKDFRIRIGVSIWILVFIIMTFLIPFVGARGGYFHAGAALMPLFLAMVPIGLEKFIFFGKQLRDWKPGKARIGFSIIIIGVAFFLTLGIILTRVVDIKTNEFAWGAGEEAYSSIEQELVDLGIGNEMVVMVNNPPGYTVVTGRAAVAIPDGDEKMLIDVAKRYQVTYIILESNHPQLLDQIYNTPGNQDGLRFLGTYLDTHLFIVE